MPGNRAETRASSHVSLRDYWMKPPESIPDQPGEPRRRTALHVTTPSLWEQTPMLATLAASPIAPGDESTQAVSAFRPQGEAAHVSENTLASPAHPTERLQRRGVSLLSDAELLSIVIHADQG